MTVRGRRRRPACAILGHMPDSRPLRIATVNVNGIRASVRRGFDRWLATRGCDVVALQEVRCPVDELPEAISDGWHLAYSPGEIPGRNGVAILSRATPSAIRIGTGSREFDREGRYLEVDLPAADGQPALTVASLYLPKGATQEDDPARYARKMRFLRGFVRFLDRTRRDARRAGREYLIMGDFNIAHEPLDYANWRASRHVEGFLPEERAWLDARLTPRTLIDVVRRLHPDQPGPYSWWSWRGQAFTNDTGWRIDYHLATPRLAKAALVGGTDRDASYEERLSDHAPVVVDYAFPVPTTTATAAAKPALDQPANIASTSARGTSSILA